MKRISFLLLLLSLSPNLFSQEIKVGSIPTSVDERGTQFIIGKKGEKTYVFRIPNDHKSRGVNVFFGMENPPLFSIQPAKSFGVSNTDESISNIENYFTKSQYYYLDIYDSEMNLISSKKIDAIVKLDKKFRMESKIIYPRKIYFKNGELMVISSYYEADINKLSFGYSKMDEEGNLGKTLNVFAEIPSDNNDIERQFKVEFSPDSSNLLIYGKSEDKTKKTLNLVTKVVETSHFKLIGENEFSFSQKSNYIKIEDIKADNTGNLWILMQSKCTSAIHEKSDIPYFSYNLFSCPKGNNSLKEVNIKISETNQIQHIALEADNTGVYVSGSYSPKSASGHTGIFFQKIDPGTLKDLYSCKFPYANDLVLKRTNFFHIRQIKHFNNNHHLLVAENYHTMLGLEPAGKIGRNYEPKSINDGPRTTQRTAYGQYLYFLYEEILLIDLDEKGEVVWMKRIPKYQESVNTESEASSYFINIGIDKISLLFNASGNTMVAGKDKAWPESGIQLYQFDYDGNFTNKELYRDVPTQTSMIPKGSKNVGNNELILYNNCKDKKFRYSKVIL